MGLQRGAHETVPQTLDAIETETPMNILDLNIIHFFGCMLVNCNGIIESVEEVTSGALSSCRRASLHCTVADRCTTLEGSAAIGADFKFVAATSKLPSDTASVDPSTDNKMVSPGS